jgi:hypothetical protein
MWCIAALTPEYRKRMYHLLALYARPLRRDEPVVCVDEKSMQLLADSRAPVAMKPGRLRKEDYEYVRRGTINLFVAVEPKAGRRNVAITERRCKSDFVAFVRNLLSHYLQVGAPLAFGGGQSEHSLREKFHRRTGQTRGYQVASAGSLPLHTEARQLAEHGGNRNWRPHTPVLESSIQRDRQRARGAATPCQRLAEKAQRATKATAMDIHEKEG